MPRAFEETSAPALPEKAFSFNVITAFALNRLALPIMLEGGGGRMINIWSIMGRASGGGSWRTARPRRPWSHLTRLPRRDLAPKIRVNAIAVGTVATSALDFVLTTTTCATGGGRHPAAPHRRARRHRRRRRLPRVPGRGLLTGKVLESTAGSRGPQPRTSTCPDV